MLHAHDSLVGQVQPDRPVALINHDAFDQAVPVEPGRGSVKIIRGERLRQPHTPAEIAEHLVPGGLRHRAHRIAGVQPVDHRVPACGLAQPLVGTPGLQVFN